MKHNKEKWLIDCTNKAIDENPGFYTIITEDKKGNKKLIALVRMQPEASSKQMNEDEANVKIINSASDLLKGIQESQEIFEMLINRTPTGELRNKLCDANIQLLNLIKKATE